MGMKYFSMFSGIGGFEYGIKKAHNNKYESQNRESEGRGNGNTNKREDSICPSDNSPLCIGFSEIDKYAIQIYKKHFPNHKNYGSATEIKPEELPDFDMLCGGFPCQAFSIAGKRMGFEDTRGTLFFDIARIVKVKRPRFLFLENVKGLLNHDNGRTFATILATIDELGYNAEWEVLNSKYFGVPQNRERVFIIGHLRGTSSRQIFPLGQECKNNNEENKRSISSTITSSYGRGWGGGRELICLNKPSYENGDGFEMGKRVYSDEGISPTLQKGDSNDIKMFKDNRIRRLTTIECERLQGFPDNWTEGVSDTQRYKTLGNAVTTNVITAVAEKLLK